MLCRARPIAAGLIAAATTIGASIQGQANDTLILRVGTRKAETGRRSRSPAWPGICPTRSNGGNFPLRRPFFEAINAGVLDVGYIGDLVFLTVYASGAPIKAIGATRSDPSTQAVLVKQDSPIKSAADLQGKRLAATRGGWEEFLIDATLEQAGHRIADATFAPLGLDRRAGGVGALCFVRNAQGRRARGRARRGTDADDRLHRRIQAIASKRAALQDLIRRLDKARPWSLDHLAEYANGTAELTKLPENVLHKAYKAQDTSSIAIDENVIKEVQEASDRSTRYGTMLKKLDDDQAVDRSFTAPADAN